MTQAIPFGEWLRKQRRALDLTRQALADQAGCAEITLRRIENGTLKPSKELAQILLEKLDIPESERQQWILFARGLGGFPTSPSGTVTFLFTDIEGSTKLAREHPEIWEVWRARHHAILQKAIESNKGYIFQIIGDAFCAAFHTTEDAIHAAVESQKNLQAENWGDVPIRVRMGINTGKAEIQKNGEYHGYLAMSRVQRLMSAAHGGQTLLSATTEQLTHDALSKDITLRDLGERRLKDMPQPEHIFQLIIPSLPVDFPTLRTLEASPNNLPTQLTSFIGREKEQAEVIKHIRKYRLVTLTGPGGVGKTRLSIKVGEQALGDYANGVWLVELASLNEPALLPQTVMALFDIAAQSNTSPTEILINFLRTKTSLFILDNCEHIVEACAQLADTLLKNCPNLKILATSRESLGITGEATYPVPSLGLPDLQQLFENFRGYESVRLFEERAQLAKMDFSLMMENASSVAQICHRLDGIPLAIELAAAHVNMFSTNQIATRLNESFNLLTGGSRTALPRQQTIRASIEWGWNLLSDSERILLRRLSVFAGGWILESAEAVCGGDHVSELISQLVAKSLVVMNQALGRERRYHLLETIRQYADEKLIEAGEKENIRTQHLKYFLKLSEEIEPGLSNPQQVEWFARTGDEIHNLRAALEWAAKTDVEAGLSLASRLGHYWISFEYSEGARWLTQFLQNPQAKEYPNARAHALIIQGHILADMEQFVPAHSLIEECLEFYRASGNQQGEIDSLLLLARLLGVEKEGAALNQQALDLARSIDDVWREAGALQALGWDHRDTKRALAYWEESIVLYRQVGDLRRLARLLSRMANYVLLDGGLEYLEYAQKLLDESIELNQLLNNKSLIGEILFAKGNMALMQGDYELARASFQQHVIIHNEIGQEVDWAYSRLGYVALREGNLTEAHQIFYETAGSFYKKGNNNGLASTLEGIASLNVVIGKPERAAQLIGWADAIREKIGDTRWRVEQDDVDRDIATILVKIGNAAFEEAYDKGRVMTLDEAVALALEEN